MLVVTGPDDLEARVGQELGVSNWFEVTQEKVDAFADVTGDDQWIHVDRDRAREAMGGTISHGYLTLALGPHLSREIMRFEQGTTLNYGLDRVRFPSPMPVGQRVRMRSKLLSVHEVPGGTQVRRELTFEREGGEKPVCVAESLTRVMWPSINTGESSVRI